MSNYACWFSTVWGVLSNIIIEGLLILKCQPEDWNRTTRVEGTQLRLDQHRF